jgi:DNA-binding transcriptional MerR regulator
MEVFLEAADVARELGNVSIAAVRFAVLTGRLQPSARTRRGTRLYTLRDVAAFRRRRESGTNCGVARAVAKEPSVDPSRPSQLLGPATLPLLDHDPAWPLEALLVEEVRSITVAMQMDDQQAILEEVTRTATGSCMDTVRDAPDRWLRESIRRCAQFRLDNHLPPQQLPPELRSHHSANSGVNPDDGNGSRP